MIHHPKLERFFTHYTATGDGAVDYLLQMNRLEQLVVQHTRITEAGAERLRQGLPHAKIVSDYGTWEPAPSAGE